MLLANQNSLLGCFPKVIFLTYFQSRVSNNFLVFPGSSVFALDQVRRKKNRSKIPAPHQILFEAPELLLYNAFFFV